MKASFNDFICEHPNCSNLQADHNMQRLFAILSEDENIIAMIDAAETGKPALFGCVGVIEQLFDNGEGPDLTNGFIRTAVGRMIKTMITPFGYTVTSKKDLPKTANARYFVSGSCYKKTNTGTLKVVKTIVCNVD